MTLRNLILSFLKNDLLQLVCFSFLGLVLARKYDFESFDFTPLIYLLLAYNLLSIGLYGSTYSIDKLELSKNKKIILSAVTIGVLLKTIFIGGALYFFWRDTRAFLLGVIVAQIDPLSIAHLFEEKKSRLSKQGQTILRAWSSFDDPISVLLLIYFALPFLKPYIESSTFENIPLSQYFLDLGYNFALMLGSYSIYKFSKLLKPESSKIIEGGNLIISFIMALTFKLMFAISVIGIFVRPNFEKFLQKVLLVAFLISAFLLGVLMQEGIEIVWGFSLALLTIIAQIIATIFITPDLSFKDRVYLSFAQQSGITAIILAIFLENFVQGTVAIVAPAIFFINIGRFVFNQILDEYFDTCKITNPICQKLKQH